MEKEVKITPKMEMAIKAIQNFKEGAFAREVLDYLNKNVADRTDLKTFNAVNATLAYAVKAGLLNSAKAVFNDKMLTKYTVNDNTPTFEEVEAE